MASPGCFQLFAARAGRAPRFGAERRLDRPYLWARPMQHRSAARWLRHLRSSRHTPCAVTGGRHTACACYGSREVVFRPILMSGGRGTTIQTGRRTPFHGCGPRELRLFAGGLARTGIAKAIGGARFPRARHVGNVPHGHIGAVVSCAIVSRPTSLAHAPRPRRLRCAFAAPLTPRGTLLPATMDPPVLLRVFADRLLQLAGIPLR